MNSDEVIVKDSLSDLATMQTLLSLDKLINCEAVKMYEYPY